jgi:hypothetical protein
MTDYVLFTLLGILSVAFVLPNTSVAGSCVDDRSCSFNGVCVPPQRTCHCDTGWKGVYCEALDLAAVRNVSGLQDLLIQENISTWGGSVLHMDAFYHMWFSEITQNRGIHRWVSNSVVSHAISEGPKDKWKFQKTNTVWPVFTHEPIAVQDPTTGELAVFVSHFNGSATDSGLCQCQDGSTSSATRPECQGESGLGGNKTMYTYFATATNPQGPWSPLISIEATTSTDLGQIDLNNFAPLIFSNGSLIAWTRWDIWTANNWKDPSSYQNQGQAPNWNDPNGEWEGEDPSMWMDSKGRFPYP